jgi:hypothetical protein
MCPELCAGMIAHSMCLMSTSLDVHYSGQAALQSLLTLTDASMCIFHVCIKTKRGENLLWNIQNKGPVRVGPGKMDHYTRALEGGGRGLVGASLEAQEVLVTMDAAKDVRYCEVRNCSSWRVNCGPWRVNCGPWRVNCGPWRVNCGPWRVNCGPWCWSPWTPPRTCATAR